MYGLIPLFGIVCGMVTTVVVIMVIARTRQRRFEMQTSVQTKLIDRFSSAPELIDFLQSPTGREFVSGVQSAPAMLTRERIVTGVSRSILLMFIGLAFFGMSWATNVNGLLVPGVIFFVLGAGYLVASYASYRLSIHFGLAASDVRPPAAAPRTES
jgi:hypothetical protein